MKVLCVNDKIIFGKPEAPWMIKENEVYEVIQEHKNPKWGVYYELAIQPHVAYAHEHFVPISEIDETTFERNYQTATI